MPTGATSPKNSAAVASEVSNFALARAGLLQIEAASFSSNVSVHCSGKYERDSRSSSKNGQVGGNVSSARPVSAIARARAIE